MNPSDSILTKSEEFKRISQEIEDKRKEQKKFEEKINKLRKDQDYLTNLKSELESKTLKMNLLKEKVKKNSNARMQDKHANLENDLLVFNEQILKLKEMEQKQLREIEELYQEKSKISNVSDKGLKEIWKEKVKKFESDIKALTKEISNLKATIYKSETERDDISEELKKMELEYRQGEKDLDDLNLNYTEKKKSYLSLKKQFEELNVLSLFFFKYNKNYLG